MAPKQKGSFLTRGRQRVQQTQQMKQSAARQLPPKGGTGANKPKATAQRTATAVTQRVRQDVATLRALGENMKRNQARAERQIPADKSPSVRRVGPGGANPKPQGQLPPGQRGGDMRQRGGALATRDGGAIRQRGSAVTPPRPNGGPVRPVSVRDLGNNKPAQVGGGRGGALPPGQRGAAAPARPGGVPRLPGGGRAPIGMGGLRGGLLLAAGTAAADYVGTKAGNAIGTAIRQASEPKVTGSRTGRTGRGGTTNDVGGNPARDGRYIPGSQQVEIKDRSGRPKPPTTPTLPASVRSSTSGGSSGSSTRASSPTGRSSSAPKPPSTTGSSKPQDNSAPKPPDLPKVETETSDAPKPPTIKSSASKKPYKRVLGADRQDMIEDNIRRARNKPSK